jgi:hypothetical protein
MILTTQEHPGLDLESLTAKDARDAKENLIRHREERSDEAHGQRS